MILQLIGWACVAHLAVDFISELDSNETLPYKPFKCDMCFGYWISVIPLVYQTGLVGFLYAGIVGVLADFIFRLKDRL